MGRVDYYHNANAPAANSLVVGSSAIVVNSENEILLQRRSDSGNWALPGGSMDIGETIAESAIREVREETGFNVQVDRIVGIYSDPGHVFAYDDGEVRQEFSVCFACTILSGSLQVSDESTAVSFFAFEDLQGLKMHKSIHIRIQDYLNCQSPALR